MPAALVLVSLLLLAGCGGEDEPEPAGERRAPEDTRAAAPRDYSHRGLDVSNEDEVAVLVRERLGPPARVRCRTSGRLPGASGSRFACRAGSAHYRVEWEHYGTGRYVIARLEADGSSREVARGTLSISE